MKKNNKKLKFISLILLIIFCLYFQTVVYSAISSKLMITGDAVARIRSNVRINKFRIHEVSDGVISSYEEFSKTYTMSNVTLPNSDSYIIYELVIGNYEDVEMQLSSITGLPSNLTYELIDYNLHDMICDNTNKCFGGVEKTLYLKIKYANYNASGTNYNINLEYEFKEFSNTLMIGTSFRDTIPASATHLVFTDEKPAAGTALTDVSAEQDMGVVGYLDGTTYKVSTRRTGIMPQANDNSSYMFSGSSLTNIDLNNLYTNNVTDMSYMFADCSNLVNIVFGDDFSTDNVAYMSYMFSNCFLLTELDVSKFNTSNVTMMDRMFYHCESLNEINVSSFNTTNVTTLKSMFNGCYKLTSLDLLSFNTENVVDMSFLFKLCSNLTYIDTSSFNTSNVTIMSFMFEDCTKLASLDVSHFDTQNVTDMTSMFNGLNLNTLDLRNFNTKNVTIMAGMFATSNFKVLDLSIFNTSKVKDMNNMFSMCDNLIELNITSFDTRNVTNMQDMFRYCSSLKSLDLSNFTTTKVTNMSYMFYKCFDLKKIDLSSFNTSNVKNMSYMFFTCSALEKIYIGENWNTSAVTSSDNMFTDSHLLPNFDSNYVDVTKAYSGEGGYLTKINKFYIDDVSYMCDDNMTWEAWADSEYNVDNFKSVMGAYYYLSKNGENPGYFIKNSNGDFVHYYDSTINVNEKYTLEYEEVSHNGGSAD